MELFLRYYKKEKLNSIKRIKLQDISIELEQERINIYYSDLSDFTNSLFLYFDKVITKQSTNRIEEIMKYLHKQETIILNISEEENKDFLISIE